MIMKTPPQTDEATVETKTEAATLVSRRGFLKKAAYQAPTLMVMGSLTSVKTATAASCCPIGEDCGLLPPCDP